MKRWEFTLVVEAEDNNSWLHDLGTTPNVHTALKSFLVDALTANGVPVKLALVEYQETFDDDLTASKLIEAASVSTSTEEPDVKVPVKSVTKNAVAKKK